MDTTFRQELERIYIFETTELKLFQDAMDGKPLDTSSLDIPKAIAATLVLHKATHAMVMRIADEIDAMRGDTTGG